MTTIRGAILDLDGTLIDSNGAHARAWQEAMAEEGFHPPDADVRRLIGMGGTFLVAQALGIEADSAVARTIRRRRQEIFGERYLPHLKPFPQVRQLLERMQGEGLKLVLASASKREEVEKMLALAGIGDLVQDTTSASDVDDPKPEPDVILTALAKLALTPDQALLLGDTPYDLEAAERAGVGAVAVESGGWRRDELTGAVAVYRDAADLLANFDASPFARHG